MNKVRAVKHEPMGYASRKAASDDSLAEDNPNVRDIRQLIDGSWVPVWATGAVTDKRGRRIKPEMIEWAPEPMLTISVEITDEMRRKVARRRVCNGELATNDELRLWAVNVLAAGIAALEDL